jgi:hypothetical protein
VPQRKSPVRTVRAFIRPPPRSLGDFPHEITGQQR